MRAGNPEAQEPVDGGVEVSAVEQTDLEIVYVGDPMCSWCWGVAPELDELGRRRPDLSLRVVVGGLRPGPDARTVGDRMAASLEHHWRQVAARTGQPFDRSLLARRDWVYDTEPACKAVVVMRELDEPQAWPLFKRLQRAFYADGVVLTEPGAIAEVVSEFAIDHGEFERRFESREATKATWKDFALARNWGITGFPTVILRQGDRGTVIAQGYTVADDMELTIDYATDPEGGAFCTPGEVC